MNRVSRITTIVLALGLALLPGFVLCQAQGTEPTMPPSATPTSTPGTGQPQTGITGSGPGDASGGCPMMDDDDTVGMGGVMAQTGIASGTMGFGNPMMGSTGVAGMGGNMVQTGAMGAASGSIGSMGSGCPMTSDMADMSGSMAGSGSPVTGLSMQGGGLVDSEGNLNPWWLLGWIAIGLLVICLIGGLVFGAVWLARRSRPGTPAQSS